jgi:preprotein translocase subunit SecF
MLKIIEKTKIWFSISLIIILIGVVAMIKNHGLELGIDFKGGTIVTINMEKDFNKDDAKLTEIIKKYAADAAVTKTNDANSANELEIKSANLKEEDITKMFTEIKTAYSLKASSPTQQESIGASLGSEMLLKAYLAVFISCLAMLVYIAIRFEIRFGIAAILSLIHDVLITLAFYALFRIPVDSAFIAAILTIIGYSINDTIVVFDRIRENKVYFKKTDYVELGNASINQTMARSINTVLTVVIMLVALYFFVPTIRSFSKPLLVGIISGCYSSIFIATPFWVIFSKMKNRKSMKPASAK